MAITFFGDSGRTYAVETVGTLAKSDIDKFEWLFSGAKKVDEGRVDGRFTGPRREMITPWSTNAVEIARNMGIDGVVRIEEFAAESECDFDPMLNRKYDGLDDKVFALDIKAEPIWHIENIAEYNKEEGLVLSEQEVAYLERVAEKMGRPLTDSEVFGFSQVNSEHCRHKIFNGQFVIDGVEQGDTLFSMIKKTTKTHPGRVVSAYKDNCAFLEGPVVEHFAPKSGDKPDYYATQNFESVLSIKAETHNFPTTVEPFNGAATGSGGEIRDRIAGGKGAFPLAGTAVYMTAYPRLGRKWDNRFEERNWLYQTPEQILIKASNGASDFGNKFGQPLLCGSVLTFEHEENGRRWGFDKVIMQAGGIGFGRKKDSLKDVPKAGDRVVVMGGDNYRIGMGGGAVSSVATGEFSSAVELNAVQRSNPEMQRRVYNAIRAVSEQETNPIVSIHDHGAGGHLNCLSELVEETGGRIELEKLPVGDPTLSAREIIGNESQERMGLVVEKDDVDHLRRIADRERAPFYDVGETTGDGRFTFASPGGNPIDWPLEYMFGSAPKTVMNDVTVRADFGEPNYKDSDIKKHIEQVLRLEAVACKDWLVNKVDRSVGGRTAMQQTAGKVQLPVNDCAVVALDFRGRKGIATSLGHAPVAGMADAVRGSQLAIAEALTNIVFAPLTYGLGGVSLSANWMWPTRNEGEDARLYDAVRSAGEFAQALGVNIPTGKDSLSMTQKYPDGGKVVAPGTVIITAAGEVSDVRKTVSAALSERSSEMVYVDLSNGCWGLGGSSFAQTVGAVGMEVPTVEADYFARGFGVVQELIKGGKVLAGHDVSAGGLVTALLEMNFTNNESGMKLDLSGLGESCLHKLLFSERPGVVIQVEDGGEAVSAFAKARVRAYNLGIVTRDRKFSIGGMMLDIDRLRDVWYETSYLLDRVQSGEERAGDRRNNFAKNPLEYRFPEHFTGKVRVEKGGDRIRAAVIREKGCQCERETAWMMHLAGMEVRDVHMTDLISGRETLEDVNFVAFAGGFSNSDVLGSAKGWAGAFLYNEKARRALENFYAREDTLSIGICNGCQLMVELGLVGKNDGARMLHNDTHRFESAFLGVEIGGGRSVMLDSLNGSRLGVWISHGEGKFSLPKGGNIVMKYCSDEYPANPNGSDFAAAAIASADGRHLAMMPHLERATHPWNWAYYPEDRRLEDEVSPWVEAFENAVKWVCEKKNG